MAQGMSLTNFAKRQALLNALAHIDLPSGAKAIPLTKGKHALVDEADYEFLMQWNWQYREGYAKRIEYGSEGRKVICMHNVILPSPYGKETDHKSSNGLDNRRENLRPGTHQQNMWNRKPVTGSSSKFKGVSFQKATNYWKAYIKINEKQKHLGCYWHEEDAARAYNRAARELHGDFAKLNQVEDGPCPSIIVR